nr:DUF4149 domain-containing protein [Gemmatales bacterium]
MLLTLVKMVHLVALGLWAGAMFFFSFFTALPIIGKVPELMTRPDHWLQLSDAKAGTRVAGEVLDILFQRYFPFQAAVGIVTVLTAVWLATVPGWLGKIRLGLLALALLLLAVNWMVLAPAVHQA